MGPSDAAGLTTTVPVRVDDVRQAASDVRLFVLSAAEGALLPAVAAGAHVDLHLPDGRVRPYSVVTPLSTPTAYAIAIKREDAGRGGSIYLHDYAAIGAPLRIGHPRNHFPLNEAADETILLAGGIGITPLYSMFERLLEIGRPVHLHYWCRSPAHALFRGRLETHPHATIHYAALDRPTLASVLERAGADADLYCCGPERMLLAFEKAAPGRPAGLLHVERFSAPDREKPVGAFSVVLARSGREVLVPEGKTILEALRDADIDVAYSCEEGVCGACEVKVLAGTPIHRDAVRTPAEHDRLSTVMICCAGSLSPSLTLAL